MSLLGLRSIAIVPDYIGDFIVWVIFDWALAHRFRGAFSRS
jgi:hypothetical protein